MINRLLTILILISILGGCTSDFGYRNGKGIDIIETENKVLPLIENLVFNRIAVSNGLLIINDTLIAFKTDTTDNPKMWIKEKVTVHEWNEIHNYPDSLALEIRDKLNETNNYRVIKDAETYFFSEGGWIDSNFGKAFTKKENIDLEGYKFDRVKELDPINEHKFWYSYYAD